MNTCIADDAKNYFSSLLSSYPELKRWDIDTEKTVIFLARKNLVEGIEYLQCLCNCIKPDLWQKVADIGAELGYRDLILLAENYAYLNYGDIGVLARHNDHPEIAEEFDGASYIIDNKFSSEYNDFPANFGPTGDPDEDKGVWEFDYRMQDYKEDMIPEEPNIFEDEDESYFYLENEIPIPLEFYDDEDEDLLANQFEEDINLAEEEKE